MSIIDNAVLLMKPTAYKAGTLYSALPNTAAGDFDVSRASARTRINQDGQLETIAANVPAIDWSDGTPALSTEPARSNLITYPISFDNAYWTKSGCTVVGGYSSPSNNTEFANEAFLLTATSANGYIQLATPITITNATDHANSIWVKRATGTGTVYIKDINNAETAITVTGAWQRFNKVSTSTSTSGQIGLKLATSGDAVYIAFAQPEVGSYTTSTILPTTLASEGSVVSRSADAITGAGDASLFSGINSSGVLYWEGSFLTDDGIGKMISLHTGSGAQYITIRTTSVGEIECLYWNGSTVVGITEWTGGTLTDLNKIAYRWKDNEFTMYANGSEVAQNTSAGSIINTFTMLSFQRGNNSNYFYANTKTLEILPYSTDCEALTTQ